MDLQALFDALGESSRMTRSGYHLTLGKAISMLETVEPSRLVEFDKGGSPSDAHSYRGYYSDLAFEPVSGVITASAFLAELKDSLGRSFEGYKGGDFPMTDTTPLWAAQYGSCGRAIVGVQADGAGPVILVTREVE